MNPDEDLEQRVRRILAQHERQANGHAEPPDNPFVDWHDLWNRDRTDQDWLLEPLIPRGRGIAIVAGAKTGKSYLLLYCAAALATGRPILHTTAPEPIPTLYADFEMGEDDLIERLERFGYDETTNLQNLHYMLHPILPPLDTQAGGQALTDLCQTHHIQLVMIDTLGKAVIGDENDADTLRSFYRHTGQPLKAQGITWLRADHLGKDPTKGARGTSAKTDDVDIVWQLTRTDDGLTAKATHRRIAWVPETVAFAVGGDPVNFHATPKAWPAGTQTTAELLDKLDIPLNESVRKTQRALQDAGQGRQYILIQAALKWRREQPGHTPGHTPNSPPPETPPDTWDDNEPF